MGDNTGSYFREDLDAQRVRALLVDPFVFHLSPDPLTVSSTPTATLTAPTPPAAFPPSAESVGGGGYDEGPKPGRRWGRKVAA